MGYDDPLISSISGGPGPATLRYRKAFSESGTPSPPRPRSSSPRQSACFTTLTLSSKYDDAPLETKLWLQSRIKTKGSDKLQDPGWARPITVANTGIQLDLIRLMWPRCARIMYRERRRLGPSALVYLMDVVLDGVMRSVQLWANSQVLDLVELSFRGTPATWTAALGAAGLATGIYLFERVRSDVFGAATSYLQNYVDYKAAKAYLKTQLGLDLQTMKNPTYMALVYEAGTCTGENAWGQIRTIGETISSLIQVATAVAVIIRTIVISSPESHITPGNIALVGLSLAPTILQLVREKVDAWVDPYGDDPDSTMWRDVASETRTMLTFTQDDQKQELILFGFKDWVLKHWEYLTTLQMEHDLQNRFRHSYLATALDTLEETVKNGFYVLLATRAIPTTLSLGAITMHGQMANDLLWSFRSFSDKLHAAYQFPFLLAAFFAVENGPQRLGPQLDYEAHRLPGGLGMRLEARNLGFTYPQADKPSLHDINLVVEPGESLAIVGFNGSGKTTLIKTLLGLHSHTGELRINDHDIDDYNPETMHKRMSCLFQDYQRHKLSLRVNVGLGNADLMDDNAAINEALSRGGALEISKKIGGLDCWLNPSTTSYYDNTYASLEEAGDRESTSGESCEHDQGEGNTTSKDGDKASKPLSGSDLVVPKMGASLSGGQWQRVAISRAFMRADTADLVVFDEPSASLDPRAEAELFDRIHALSMRDGRRVTTTVFISHRFSTVRRADKIAFMENGTITEYGSHAELMALGGQYHDLFELQRSGFDG